MTKPYVRYELSSKVHDKGVGFCIERSIKAYLENHNIPNKIISLKKSSNSHRAILEIYEGNQDFNIKALISHLGNSGRLPSKKNIRPDITFKPLPCDYQLSDIEELKDRKGESWQKTCEQLGEELTKKDEYIKKLESEKETYQEKATKNELKLDLSNKEIREIQNLFSKKDYVDIKDPTDLLNIIKTYETTMFKLRGLIETISPIKFQKCLEIVINRAENAGEYSKLKQRASEAKEAMELSNTFINREEAQRVIEEFETLENEITESKIILEEFYSLYGKIINGEKEINLDRIIESVNLKEKTKNRLKHAGINTIIELSKRTEEEILNIEGIGKGMLEEIKRVLGDYNMTLKLSDIPNYKK